MLAAGAVFVIYGEISAGVMIAASIILGRALQPIEQAITHWRGFVRYKEAKQNIEGLLKNIAKPKELTSLKKPIGNLQVRGLVAHAPNSKKIVLRNINLNVPAGRILGVLGDSASGKTSLARIIVGVWKPSSGEIRIDGATYDQWQQDDLGQYLGYLPQNVELFDGTIAQNISRLKENPSSEDIIKAAKQAGAHEMIKNVGGYDVDIGIGGTNLSAGQRQRIALARALYGEPVLLVLDEPNSNLDEHGDVALFGAIKAMRERGQSVIIIAHKKNVLSLSDDLLVLHAGNQATYGTRDAVLSKIREEQTMARAGARRSKKQQGSSVSESQMVSGVNYSLGGIMSSSSAKKKNEKTND